jgi:hypothetical protein
VRPQVRPPPPSRGNVKLMNHTGQSSDAPSPHRSPPDKHMSLAGLLLRAVIGLTAPPSWPGLHPNIATLAGSPAVVGELQREISSGGSPLTLLPEAFPFPLDDFQLDTLRALHNSQSVVVSAPTGSGKTVCGELGIYLALANKQRVVYTTPLKALSNQKFGDLQRQFGRERVGLLTGDTCINRDADVLVMTTEVYRNMLYKIDPTVPDEQVVGGRNGGGSDGDGVDSLTSPGLGSAASYAYNDDDDDDDPLNGVGYVVLDEFHCASLRAEKRPSRCGRAAPSCRRVGRLGRPASCALLLPPCLPFSLPPCLSPCLPAVLPASLHSITSHPPCRPCCAHQFSVPADMNDPSRGTVWEECCILSPPSVALIALSATLTNADLITAWLTAIHGPTALVASDYRPVPLR